VKWSCGRWNNGLLPTGVIAPAAAMNVSPRRSAPLPVPSGTAAGRRGPVQRRSVRANHHSPIGSTAAADRPDIGTVRTQMSPRLRSALTGEVGQELVET
jgi:hypothetical protein